MSTLTTITCNDEIAVEDPEGGIWWPSDDAQTEIDASEDPAVRVMEICDAEPMRGEWRQ